MALNIRKIGLGLTALGFIVFYGINPWYSMISVMLFLFIFFLG